MILPWYKSAIYTGLNIDGVWEEIHEHKGAVDTSKLAITQNAHRLKGLMTVVKVDKATNVTEIKNFNLKGSFHDGHIILSGNNANYKTRGHVIYLLRVAQGGKTLEGCTSWVDVGNDNISTSETFLSRENA